MECSEIMEVCRKLVSEDCTCGWDSPGPLAGGSDKEVRRVYTTLDTADKVVEIVVASGADILLTHHPLVFRAIKKVNNQNFITRRLVKLIQADISYYAIHTNFDVTPDCMADLAAERLGLSDCVPLGALGETDDPGGAISCNIGKSGALKEEVTARELVAHAKDAFGPPFVLVYGDEPVDQKVSCIFVRPGIGGSGIEGALAWGAQVLMTGDTNHYQGIDTMVRSMAIIDGGHYRLERIFIPYMAGFLRKNPGSRVELEQAPFQRFAVIAWQENQILENKGGKWNSIG